MFSTIEYIRLLNTVTSTVNTLPARPATHVYFVYISYIFYAFHAIQVHKLQTATCCPRHAETLPCWGFGGGAGARLRGACPVGAEVGRIRCARPWRPRWSHRTRAAPWPSSLTGYFGLHPARSCAQEPLIYRLCRKFCRPFVAGIVLHGNCRARE
jgi:hypothetical protein